MRRCWYIRRASWSSKKKHVAPIVLHAADGRWRCGAQLAGVTIQYGRRARISLVAVGLDTLGNHRRWRRVSTFKLTFMCSGRNRMGKIKNAAAAR